MSRSSPSSQPLALMADRILARAQVDEHVVAVHGDREAAQLVGELVERPAGRRGRSARDASGRSGSRRRRSRGGAESPCAGSGCRRRSTSSPSANRQSVWPVEVDDEAACRAQLFERRGADGTVCCDGGHSSGTLEPQVRLKSSGCRADDRRALRAERRRAFGAPLLRAAGADLRRAYERQPAPLRPRDPAADRARPGRPRRRHPA